MEGVIKYGEGVRWKVSQYVHEVESVRSPSQYMRWPRCLNMYIREGCEVEGVRSPKVEGVDSQYVHL